MRYIWTVGGKQERRVMHIERHDQLGNGTMRPLCHIDLPFNRSINTPFGLGRSICKRCRAIGETPE